MKSGLLFRAQYSFLCIYFLRKFWEPPSTLLVETPALRHCNLCPFGLWARPRVAFFFSFRSNLAVGEKQLAQVLCVHPRCCTHCTGFLESEREREVGCITEITETCVRAGIEKFLQSVARFEPAFPNHLRIVFSYTSRDPELSVGFFSRRSCLRKIRFGLPGVCIRAVYVSRGEPLDCESGLRDSPPHFSRTDHCSAFFSDSRST